MGRSRLAYRAKHKSILSENSRRQIREARRRDRQESEINQQECISSEEESPRGELDMIQCGINLLAEPKLYIRDSEYSDYLKENYIGITETGLTRDENGLCNLFSAFTFSELGLMHLSCYDKKTPFFNECEAYSQPTQQPPSPSPCSSNSVETTEESAVLSALDDILGFSYVVCY